MNNGAALAPPEARALKRHPSYLRLDFIVEFVADFADKSID